ncbi:MAG: hypothetical protein WCK63_10255 [Betaproteobacteria bacterium]
MLKADDAYEKLVAEWTGEVGQLHLSIKALPAELRLAADPPVKAIKDASFDLNRLLAGLPAALEKENERARVDSVGKMAEAVTSLAGVAGEVAYGMVDTVTETARLNSAWKAAVAMSGFGSLLVALGAFVGNERAAWGSPVAFGVIFVIGAIAGVLMGYFVFKTAREKKDFRDRATAYYKSPHRVKMREGVASELLADNFGLKE